MTTHTARNRLFVGAACILLGALMLALSGVAVRLATASLSTESIVFWRSAISVLILLPWAMVQARHWFRADNMSLIGLRAGTFALSLYCYYYAISVISLADAALLVSSSPIFVPLFGLLLFRFPLDRRALAAVLVGFLGVALILDPAGDTLNLGASMALLAGIFGAVGVVVVWKMPADEDPARIAFFLALLSAAVFALPAAVSGDWPRGADWWPLLALGLSSTLAHLLFAYACLIAPADRIITLEYSVVVFASALAWLIWDEQPGLLLILGGALIVGASVLVVRSPPPASTGRRRPSGNAHEWDGGAIWHHPVVRPPIR